MAYRKLNAIRTLVRSVSTIAASILGSSRSLGPVRVALLTVVGAGTSAWAQSAPLAISAISGSTPTAMAPGAPDGSYSLTGFDTVNLGNGHINFNLPVLKLPARGDNQVTLNLPIQALNRVNWRIDAQPYPVSGTCGANGCTYNYTYTPKPTDWNPYTPGFGTASLVQRSSGDSCVAARDSSLIVFSWSRAQTRLTFTETDGTEHELWDKGSGGQPQTPLPAPGFSRGQTFVSHDGTGIVFTSDTPIYDPIATNDQNGCRQLLAVPMTGNLVLRNGTVYRFKNGRVSSITDRNGNQITYCYGEPGCTGNPTSTANYMAPPLWITDSFQRDTRIVSTANGYTINYAGVNGTPESIIINFDTVSNRIRDLNDPVPLNVANLFTAPLDLTLVPDGAPTFFNVISEVIFPNNQKYSFFYEKHGYVARIVLPTGGAYEYDYVFGNYVTTGGGSPKTSPYVYVVTNQVTERREYVSADSTVTPQNHQGTLVAKTTYACPSAPSAGCAVTFYDAATVSLGSEQHYYPTYIDPSDGASYSGWQDGRETKRQSYDASGGLLHTVATSWQQRDCSTGPNCWFTQTPYSYALSDPRSPAHDPQVASEQTTLNDSTAVQSQQEVSQTVYQYDNYNNRTDIKEYAYGSGIAGSLVRETKQTYIDALSPSGPNYLSRNMISLPYQRTVYDASGTTIKAQTTLSYDETAVDDCPSIVEHDPASGTAFQVGRGNLSSLSSRLYDPIANTTRTLTATRRYDIAGNVVESFDPRAVHEKYSYHDNDARNTYGLVTSVKTYPKVGLTSPVFSSYATYDYDLAKPLTASDVNGNLTTLSYRSSSGTVDPLGRLISVTRPDSSLTTFAYIDTPNAVRVSTSSDVLAAGDQQLQSATFYDGLGRLVKVQSPDGNCIFTSYDAKGRVFSVSNPGMCGGAPPITTTTYDGLSRVLKVTAPDLSVAETRYAGPLTLVLDSSPQHKTRQMTTDAQGRLTGVVENQITWRGQAVGVAAEPVLTTSYANDELDNLGSMTQGSQSRTFSYDSLSRLVQAMNPESGTIRYGYDDSGNLTSRKFNQSGQITMTSTYDGLNRPLDKSYLGGSVATPGVTYCYDGYAFDPVALNCGSTATVTGAAGRLTGIGSSASSTNFTNFSNRGFVVGSKQTTAGKDYTFGYSYWASGALQTMTYPSQRQVKYSLDTAGRIQQVQNGTGTGAPSYASSILYADHGAIKHMTLGNGIEEITGYSPERLQPTSIVAKNATTTFLSLTYSYCASGAAVCPNNNGNVQSQNITRLSGNWVPTYTYDSLNRLTGAIETGTGSWAEGYVYDAWGNRALCVANQTPAQTCTPARQGLPDVTLETPTTSTQTVGSWYTANNQLSGWSYDQAGNLLQVGNMARTFTYDAENRQVTATVAGILNSYTYDAEGRRVTRTTPWNTTTPTTVYVYDASGQLGAEYGQATEAGGTKYLTADMLGSTRMETDSTGTPVSNMDYLPFGGEIASGTAGRDATFGGGSYPSAPVGVSLKFTGKERDAETGLDYFGARYFSGAQGRFTSADPKMFPHDITDPQSWNKYSYTRNNPLRYVDPDGEDWKDFGLGVVNSFGSDNLFGAGRASGGNSDFRLGQAVGDAVATVQGTVETIIGMGGEVGGGLLSATGVGALLGVPAIAVSTVAVVQGSSAAVLGAKNLGNAAFADNAQQSSGQPYEGSPQNQERMSKGKAPVGKDGKPVELHHEGQTTEGNLKEMTQTEHRGGENFKNNHPNTGQQPSQIDRSKFKQQREQYWKDKAKQDQP